MSLDVKIILDTLVTLAVVEVLAKPLIVYYGQKVLLYLDQIIQVIPDWLYKNRD